MQMARMARMVGKSVQKVERAYTDRSLREREENLRSKVPMRLDI